MIDIYITMKLMKTQLAVDKICYKFCLKSLLAYAQYIV